MARTTKRSSARGKRAAKAHEPDYLRLDDQLCFPICLAARLVVNAYRPLLDDLAITYSQYLVLMVLWEKDGQSVGAIGDRLHLDTGTLTPLLKRMERQGLVVRRRRKEDDRVVENFLTDAAKSLKKRAQRVPVQLMCNAGLDVGDVRSIKTVIEGLVQRLLPLQSGELPGAP
jgi:MarR family transcriptional regulator, organic hydroperoxide resistance regulator